MVFRALRVPAGELSSAALLPQVALGLAVATDFELASLKLAAPEQTLRTLAPTLTDLAGMPARAVPKRRAEFAAGRHAASLALARCGCHEPVTRCANGSPCWPRGFTGSISHGAGLAVAVAARAESYRGLGIDVESLITDEQCLAIADRILDATEFTLLARALPGRVRSALLSLGFSAKESLYKCLNPVATEFIEFEDARVSRVLPESHTSGRIWLTLQRSFAGDLHAGTELLGCYAFHAERIETLVWFDRRCS
jgi:enterobactin synthetase component D